MNSLAEAWISYRHAPVGSPERGEHAWLRTYTSWSTTIPRRSGRSSWMIHHRDNSVAVQEVLSAGPIESLLAKHGANFIDRVEAEARNDPSFAKVLGGVWQNQMPSGRDCRRSGITRVGWHSGMSASHGNRSCRGQSRCYNLLGEYAARECLRSTIDV